MTADLSATATHRRDDKERARSAGDLGRGVERAPERDRRQVPGVAPVRLVGQTKAREQNNHTKQHFHSAHRAFCARSWAWLLFLFFVLFCSICGVLVAIGQVWVFGGWEVWACEMLHHSDAEFSAISEYAFFFIFWPVWVL
jgi:hypothetical protein